MASGGKASKYRIDLPSDAPKYLRDAIKDVGIQEWVLDDKRRRVSNPIVEGFIEDVTGKREDARTTPWCAYWVGSKLERAKIPSTKSGMARSYLRWGETVWKKGDRWDPSRLRPGDLAIFWRGRSNDGVTGHIGFILHWDDDTLVILGGNQGDKVSIQDFALTKLIAVVRPRSLWKSKTMQSTGGALASETTKAVIENAVPAPHGLPDPADLQNGFDSVKEPLETLAAWKPTILLVLSLVTIALIGYAAYCRYMARKNGGI